jgi:hypothetical protein
VYLCNTIRHLKSTSAIDFLAKMCIIVIMSKPKITSETIQGILEGQEAARRAARRTNAAAAMARVAGANSTPKAPITLLERPAAEPLLPAGTTTPDIEDFVIPAVSPATMPNTMPKHPVNNGRGGRRTYTTESPRYTVPTTAKPAERGRDLSTLPAAELTPDEREAEIARLAAEQADDDTDDGQGAIGYPRPLSSAAGNQLRKELSTYDAARQRNTADYDYNGRVPFDDNDYGPEAEDQHPLYGHGMHIEG